jgi:hypothetical protein
MEPISSILAATLPVGLPSCRYIVIIDPNYTKKVI